MKKLLLIAMFAIGFADEIFAMDITDGDSVARADCEQFLSPNPDEQKTSHKKHWLLIKQLYSLSYLESIMNTEEKLSNKAYLSEMRDTLRYEINFLRNEEKSALERVEKEIMEIHSPEAQKNYNLKLDVLEKEKNKALADIRRLANLESANISEKDIYLNASLLPMNKLKKYSQNAYENINNEVLSFKRHENHKAFMKSYIYKESMNKE